jgi:hypothetical protein
MVRWLTVELPRRAKVGVRHCNVSWRTGILLQRSAVGQFSLFSPLFSVHLCVILIRYATGGSISGLLPRRPNNELNVTNSINNTGNVRSRSAYLLNVAHFCRE